MGDPTDIRKELEANGIDLEDKVGNLEGLLTAVEQLFAAGIRTLSIEPNDVPDDVQEAVGNFVAALMVAIETADASRTGREPKVHADFEVSVNGGATESTFPNVPILQGPKNPV